MKLRPLYAWRWNYERRISPWPKVLAGWFTCRPVTRYRLRNSAIFWGMTMEEIRVSYVLSLSKGGRGSAFV